MPPWELFTVSFVSCLNRWRLPAVCHPVPRAPHPILPSQRGNRLQTSESDVCRRQILTSKDGPRAERIKNIIVVDHNIGIQMKRKELTFMMISNKKKTLWSPLKNFSVVKASPPPPPPHARPDQAGILLLHRSSLVTPLFLLTSATDNKMGR